MTRDLILENLDNHQFLTVFDNTDLESSKFEFLQVGKIYSCKILLFAISKTTAKLYKKSSAEFAFLCKEIIGQKERLKVQVRYDILAVNGIECIYDLEDV
ncbi:hypothetical protein J2Z60_001107 [Lactobacillus colini]|uniref:Uncharacterized protein n=1 Tax=Lactobacillus colini TaxID=1819254 RepID=A0ABS4MEY8_9LACO|nr:hypothetical protein [Lactobacillus colini]MBP2057932.1 hypothetical protein [Lactobacillus colini]